MTHMTALPRKHPEIALGPRSDFVKQDEFAVTRPIRGVLNVRRICKALRIAGYVG
jgi:hypothetical protein